MPEITYNYELTERAGYLLVKRSNNEYACVMYENGQVKDNGYFATGKSDQSINYVVKRWVSRKTAISEFNLMTHQRGKRHGK